MSLPLIVAMALVAIGLTLTMFAVGGSLAAGVSLTLSFGLLVCIAAVVLIVWLLYWLVFRVHRLNLALIGLSGATNLPAIPIHLSVLPDTALKLLTRARQMQQAIYGLSTRWTIGSLTANAYTFMGMEYSSAAERAADCRTRLPLDAPDQFALSWTTLGDRPGKRDEALAEGLRGVAEQRGRSHEAILAGHREVWPPLQSHHPAARRPGRTALARASTVPPGRRGWTRCGRRETSTSST